MIHQLQNLNTETWFDESKGCLQPPLPDQRSWEFLEVFLSYKWIGSEKERRRKKESHAMIVMMMSWMCHEIKLFFQCSGVHWVEHRKKKELKKVPLHIFGILRVPYINTHRCGNSHFYRIFTVASQIFTFNTVFLNSFLFNNPPCTH